MKIGFIGLGTMGRHMALHLIRAGHDVAVHDLRQEAAAAHREAGARWVTTPRGVAETADVVFTSLPAPADVEAVALGERGLLEGLAAGKAYFDLSTNAPAVVRRIHAAFAARGVHMLDAPVSGGPRGAENQRLALWVGGDEAIYTRHEPLLRTIGDRPHYVGPIGAGSIAKLAHNCAGYIIQAGLAEVFTMGVKAGVDPLALWRALRQGAVGRQRTFDRLGDHFLPGTFDPPAFALRLAHKDVSLATALGREHQVPMRLAHLTLEEMTEALNRGWGQRDSRVAMLLQEERAGVEIRVAESAIREVLASDSDTPVA